MRNEIKKAMEALKDKKCSVSVQGGSSINEMSFIEAVVDCDEKCETINIATQLVYLGLNVDNCIEVNASGNEIYLQFDDGVEFEICSYTKEESETAHARLFKRSINKETNTTTPEKPKSKFMELAKEALVKLHGTESCKRAAQTPTNDLYFALLRKHVEETYAKYKSELPKHQYEQLLDDVFAVYKNYKLELDNATEEQYGNIYGNCAEKLVETIHKYGLNAK